MLRMRGELEALEQETLAPYASFSVHSLGREHPEPESKSRTCFQRDRDRVLHTTAFRRLEHKTQVFITYEGDYYRTRLTHTLEVAQIGRSLARSLGGNEDLVEAICLTHDLGHPPFGHSGEAVLSRLMDGHGGFNHNEQSLRIVTYLEQRYSDFNGLNLTWETREGMVKHNTAFDKTAATGFEPEKRGSLEAQIASVADEFAYTAHDLDDGLRSGLLQPRDLAGSQIWTTLCENSELHIEHLEEIVRHRIIRDFIGLMMEDVTSATEHRIEIEDIRTKKDLQQSSANVVGYSDALAGPLAELRATLLEKLYRHYRVVRMSLKAENFISGLFQAYLAHPQILPTTIFQRATQTDLHRVICDYIAGMTDRFAIEEHRKLFDPQTRP